MSIQKTVFSQIMEFLPSYDFHKCVERYPGHYKVQSFSCWDQFLCMVFAQLTYRASLRDIEACLRAREDYSPTTYAAQRETLYRRLIDLACANYQDREARRLAKRLEKYRDELFTFLDHPEVPATNNHAEREIRFAVLIRKITYGNRSDRGARTQSILMSIFRTLKHRGYNPVDQVVAALRTFVQTGTLPPFPPPITSEQ